MKLVNQFQKDAYQWLDSHARPIDQFFSDYVKTPLNRAIPGMWGDKLRDAAVFTADEMHPGADVRDVGQGMNKMAGGLLDRNLGEFGNGLSQGTGGFVGLFPGAGDLAKGIGMAGAGVIKGLPFKGVLGSNKKEAIDGLVSIIDRGTMKAGKVVYEAQHRGLLDPKYFNQNVQVAGDIRKVYKGKNSKNNGLFDDILVRKSKNRAARAENLRNSRIADKEISNYLLQVPEQDRKFIEDYIKKNKYNGETIKDSGDNGMYNLKMHKGEISALDTAQQRLGWRKDAYKKARQDFDFYGVPGRGESNKEAVNATIESIEREAKKRGWTIKYRSGKARSGGSRYIEIPGKGEIRLSDHELPDTPRRRDSRDYNGPARWDAELIIGNEWRTQSLGEYMDEIENLLSE